MIQVEGIFSGGGIDISVPIIGKDFNWTGGDGTYQVLEDGDGNWRIKFLSSGTFTPLRDMVIDVFLVGAGGGGYKSVFYGNGGGGGYTKTVKSIVPTANTTYSIVIGTGGLAYRDKDNPGTSGGDTSAFSETAAGGAPASTKMGGDGGSGGGTYDSNSSVGYDGGSDGSNGGGKNGGSGQGTTTREFGEANGDLYAGGGGGHYSGSLGVGGAGGGGNAKESGVANTGGGAGSGGEGGSGIVIIRKHKEAAA